MNVKALTVVTLLLTVALTACTNTAATPRTPAPPTSPSGQLNTITSNTTGDTVSTVQRTLISSHIPQPPATTVASISLGQPPGTYSLSHYTLCGRDFIVPSLQNLWVYPNIPKSVRYIPGGNFGLVVVIGDDCTQGGTIETSPEGHITVKHLVAAADGKPLVAEVLFGSQQTGTVTVTPQGGQTMTTTVGE